MRCLNKFVLLPIVLLVTDCGLDNNGEEYMTYEEQTAYDRSIDTEKLIGTPFEGLTTGDSVDPMTLLCGQYRTETIISFPIPVFSALFTNLVETAIVDAIAMANDAMGFTAYEYTETWSDDVRVIYSVDEVKATIGSPVGRTWGVDKTFNDKTYAERIVTDWAIQINYLPGAWIVAHELGHASGISGHFLIDYENDTTSELETYSIMEAGGGYASVLDDYNFMMNMQGQIMQEHLGEAGEIIEEDAGCP